MNNRQCRHATIERTGSARSARIDWSCELYATIGSVRYSMARNAASSSRAAGERQNATR